MRVESSLIDSSIDAAASDLLLSCIYCHKGNVKSEDVSGAMPFTAVNELLIPSNEHFRLNHKLMLDER